MPITDRPYTGPAIPTTYDPRWQMYTNLSPDQIAIFQSFPQDLIKYIGQKRWTTEIETATLPDGTKIDMGDTSQRKIAGLKQASDAGVLTFPISFFAVDSVFSVNNPTDINNLYTFVVNRVQATYAIAAKLVSQVNAKPQALTTRAQVDAAFSEMK